MKIRNVIYLFLLNIVLLGFMVSCSTSRNTGVEVKSFRVEPLTIKKGETVTATWELSGTGPFKVLLNNVDVSDKEFMTFEPTKTTNYHLIVEDPWITTTRLWRKVIVEP